jgi:hypothetical protein
MNSAAIITPNSSPKCKNGARRLVSKRYLRPMSHAPPLTSPCFHLAYYFAQSNRKVGWAKHPPVRYVPVVCLLFTKWASEGYDARRGKDMNPRHSSDTINQVSDSFFSCKAGRPFTWRRGEGTRSAGCALMQKFQVISTSIHTYIHTCLPVAA